MSALGSQNVEIGGNVSDAQIAVGNYILQIGDVNGGMVNVAPPSAPVKFERRTKHVSLRPRAFPSLLNRTTESASIKNAISTSTPVTLFGESGIGKTSLLRNVLNEEKLSAFADGLVYLTVREQGVQDILQLLFDSFYSENSGAKPTDGQMRAELNKIRSLVVLDDLTLSREDAASLLDFMPGSVFILASENRSLWGEGAVIALGGLPKADAFALFTRELGREAQKEETTLVEQICTALHGHPFRILEMASLAREGKSLQEILKELQGDEPNKVVASLAVNKLNDNQKSILGVLGSLGGALVSMDHLRDLANVPDLENSLKSLSGLGLIQVDGSKFGAASSLVSVLPQIMDLRPWDNAIVKHFADWLIQNPGQDLIEDAAEALAKAIQKAGEKKEWPQVVRIGRALERILILRKRWQAWADILDLLLRAARALGDKKLEGWVLHQLGSRAMCMGVTDAAQKLLSQALQIRKAIGDQAGMQLSQHNINVLMNLVPVPQSSGCRRWFTCSAAAGAGVFAIVLLAVGAYYLLPSTPTPIPPPPPRIITPSITPTFIEITPSFTPTETPTPTVTFTPEPVILYDFIEHASEATWDYRYGDPIDGYGHQQFQFTQNFVPSDKIPDPTYWMSYYKTAYAGWEHLPALEDKSEEKNVVVAYPFGQDTDVRGTYDLRHIEIQRGDRLNLRVGYRDNYPVKGFIFMIKSDGVVFNVFFEENEKQTLLVSIPDNFDGFVPEQSVDLSFLDGHSGYFILQVDSGKETYSDLAVWTHAFLERP